MLRISIENEPTESGSQICAGTRRESLYPDNTYINKVADVCTAPLGEYCNMLEC